MVRMDFTLVIILVSVALRKVISSKTQHSILFCDYYIIHLINITLLQH